MAADAILPDPRSGPEKDAALVQAMFDRVAPRYDVTNMVLSAGQDAHWRRVAVAAIDPGPGDVVLDVAAGTGALAALHRARGADVIALDFSLRMLVEGTRREAQRTTATDTAQHLWWCAGDGTRLPLADDSVDAVTIAFGLRNLPDVDAGLRELARVTKPGGQLGVLEFSTPTWAPLRTAYHRYLLGALPQVAARISSDGPAYRYLAESIAAWPDQEALAHRIAEAGWTRPRWKDLTGGIVALHHAVAAL